MTTNTRQIVVTSMVASRDKSPNVTMAIPHKDCAVQFTPNEARGLARSLIEAAHNAETDSAIFAYMSRHANGNIKTIAATLTMIREARKEVGLE